jgi:hypothetical protein
VLLLVEKVLRMPVVTHAARSPPSPSTSTSNQMNSTFLALQLPSMHSGQSCTAFIVCFKLPAHRVDLTTISCIATLFVGWQGLYQIGLTAKWCGECFFLDPKKAKTGLQERSGYSSLNQTFEKMLACLAEQFKHCDNVLLCEQWSKMVS